MADEAAQRVPSGSPESQTVEFETSYRIYFTGQTSGAQRASMIESIRTAGRDIL